MKMVNTGIISLDDNITIRYEKWSIQSILKEFKLLNKYYVLFTINAIMKNAEEDTED